MNVDSGSKPPYFQGTKPYYIVYSEEMAGIGIKLMLGYCLVYTAILYIYAVFQPFCECKWLTEYSLEAMRSNQYFYHFVMQQKNYWGIYKVNAAMEVYTLHLFLFLFLSPVALIILIFYGVKQFKLNKMYGTHLTYSAPIWIVMLDLIILYLAIYGLIPALLAKSYLAIGFFVLVF